MSQANNPSAQCRHLQSCISCRGKWHGRGRKIGFMHCVIQNLVERLAESGAPGVVDVQEALVDMPLSTPVPEKITELQTKIMSMGGDDCEAIFSNKCQVCFDAYNHRDRCAIALNCGHTMCLCCLGKLPKLECPQRCGKITHICRLYM